ncbi:sensor histidine kinase [Microvirga antarctica]|uniref:sensor histidine kinase n=1 Tax=Microvirga antarctica TaxID=2819233 RepID=UPI001B302745|nr:histidine kinase dimerization/phosphoacceptor domain -containing protein [Microvirga antarctica]
MPAKSSPLDQMARPPPDRTISDPYKAIFDTAPVAISMLDPHTHNTPVVFANAAFSRLTGYDSAETQGRPGDFLHGPESDPETAAAIHRALASGVAIEAEILSYRKDGSSFWSAVAIRPIADADGQLIYVSVSQRDVTPMRHQALESAESRRMLEREIARRTADLQTALDQKTALLHEVDHRVKNSLQVIASLVLLKARRVRSPETRRVLNELAERVAALSTVHRLLYTGGDLGRFDLGLFARELVTEMASHLHPDQVTLNLNVDAVKIPAAKGASLALLLNELVGNAVKHAFPDGRKGVLTVEIRNRGDRIHIVVDDDGVGIDHAPPPEGCFGRTLIDLLVRQSSGELAWSDRGAGTRAEVVLPVGTEEIRA